MCTVHMFAIQVNPECEVCVEIIFETKKHVVCFSTLQVGRQQCCGRCKTETTAAVVSWFMLQGGLDFPPIPFYSGAKTTKRSLTTENDVDPQKRGKIAHDPQKCGTSHEKQKFCDPEISGFDQQNPEALHRKNATVGSQFGVVTPPVLELRSSQLPSGPGKIREFVATAHQKQTVTLVKHTKNYGKSPF